MENSADREAEISHLKKLIEIHRKNLQQLELQKAMYGLDIPLTLLNSLDQTREELGRAEAELVRLEGEEARPRAVPEVSIPADVAGRDIATLAGGRYEKGSYVLSLPKQIGAGVYFVRVDFNGAEKSIKVIRYQ